MGYLVCDKCKGYYELQPGESASDFEECECGGNLRYRKKIILPKNSAENLLENSNDIEQNSKSKTRSISLFKFLGIFIGAMIIFVAAIVFSAKPEGYLLYLIGGFIAAFIIGGKDKDGVINVIIASILGAIMAAIYTGELETSTNITNILAYILGTSVAIMIFSLPGGYIGVLSRKIASDKTLIREINWRALFAGCLMCILPILIILSIFQQQFIVLSILIFGGFIAAFIAGSRYINGIRYGFFTGGISFIIIIISFFILSKLNMDTITTSALPPTLIFYFLFGSVLGLIGGLLAIFIKKRFK